MASGPALYVVRVEHRVSSLQLLCQQAIASALREDKDVSKLALPPRLCSYLSTAFTPTIKVKPPRLLPQPARLPPKNRGEEGGLREVGEHLQAERQPRHVRSPLWSSPHAVCPSRPCPRLVGPG